MRRDALVWMVRGMGVTIGVAVVIAIGSIALRAGNVLILVFVAILLASALEPFVGWVRGHIPLGRGPTLLLAYALFLVAVVGLVVLMVPVALNQAADLAASLPPLIDQAREWAARLQPEALGSSLLAILDALAEQLKPAPPPEAGEVVQAGRTVVEVVVSIVTIMAIVYFWLVEHARLQRYALAFLPAARRSGWREAWNEVETRLGQWVRGQLILMATIGVATGTAYWLLGLPSALLLGLFAAIAEAIPIVGPAVGAIPAILVALIVSPELAVIVTIVYVVLQLIEGNVLVPMVMKNTIGLSPFVVVVSLLIGAAAGGILGALLAVPIAAAIEVVLERLQAREVPVAHQPGPSPAELGASAAEARP